MAGQAVFPSIRASTAALVTLKTRSYTVEDSYKESSALVVGTSPERYAALKGGSVHASFMGPPFTFRAAKDNFRKLANFHDHLGPILFTTDFAHSNYIKSNRAEIVRYLRR